MNATANKSVKSPNLARDAKQGTVAYVVPLQRGVSGPTELIWDALLTDPPHAARLSVTLRNTADGREEPVYLRASRSLGCGEDSRFVPVNNAISCYDNRSGPLLVAYEREDNRHLKPGVYEGTFDVEARGWHDKEFAQRFALRARIAVPPQ
jgi:hypothetical protein